MLFSANTPFLTIVSIILFCSLPNVTTFASDDNEQMEKVSLGSFPVILLDKETQQNSGIQTLETQLTSYRPEFIVFGKAANIQPLLTLRHQYLQALTESKSAKARFSQSEHGIKRLRDLYSHGIAAKRSLQEQHSQWQAHKSQVEAARFHIQAILEETRLNWGKQLTDWIINSDSDKLEPFLSGERILLQITLQSNRQLAEDIQTIMVDPSGNRMTAQPASLISQAPKIDNTLQGSSYFFQAAGNVIKTGMNVSAWIPEKKDPVQGIIVPKSALIWSMDQGFVYIKTGEREFNRRMIRTNIPTSDGYFISESIKAGEKIVTTGGQMLWSEELRGQIPGNDD